MSGLRWQISLYVHFQKKSGWKALKHDSWSVKVSIQCAKWFRDVKVVESVNSSASSFQVIGSYSPKEKRKKKKSNASTFIKAMSRTRFLGSLEERGGVWQQIPFLGSLTFKTSTLSAYYVFQPIRPNPNIFHTSSHNSPGFGSGGIQSSFLCLQNTSSSVFSKEETQSFGPTIELRMDVRSDSAFANILMLVNEASPLTIEYNIPDVRILNSKSVAFS